MNINDCEHTYIVRAAQGENRFLCKECDKRFIRHPEIIRKKAELDAAIAQELEDEKQRAIENGWKPKTHQENAKALVEQLYGKS